MWSYFKDELSRGYVIEGGDGSYSERQRRIDTFMQTPRDLEKVLDYIAHLQYYPYSMYYTGSYSMHIIEVAFICLIQSPLGPNVSDCIR